MKIKIKIKVKDGKITSKVFKERKEVTRRRNIP